MYLNVYSDPCMKGVLSIKGKFRLLSCASGLYEKGSYVRKETDVKEATLKIHSTIWF